MPLLSSSNQQQQHSIAFLLGEVPSCPSPTSSSPEFHSVQSRIAAVSTPVQARKRQSSGNLLSTKHETPSISSKSSKLRRLSQCNDNKTPSPCGFRIEDLIHNAAAESPNSTCDALSSFASETSPTITKNKHNSNPTPAAMFSPSILLMKQQLAWLQHQQQSRRFHQQLPPYPAASIMWPHTLSRFPCIFPPFQPPQQVHFPQQQQQCQQSAVMSRVPPSVHQFPSRPTKKQSCVPSSKHSTKERPLDAAAVSTTAANSSTNLSRFQCYVCNSQQGFNSEDENSPAAVSFTSMAGLNLHFRQQHYGLLQHLALNPLRAKAVFQAQVERSLRSKSSESPSVAPFPGSRKSLDIESLKTEDGERYKCPQCALTVKWPTEIQKHIMVHTEERPFACVVCGQAYKWSWDLARHFEKKHEAYLPENPYRRERVTAQTAAARLQ